MKGKNRSEGPAAIMEFLHRMKPTWEPGQDLKSDAQISAKAGDKWYLTRVRMPVEFRYNDDALEIHIESIVRPFYRAYRTAPGTRFSYDSLKALLFVEGHLNNGRGNPYVVCISS
jgi:hypothetical protein